MMKTATVRYDPAAVSPEHLVGAIRSTGYGAALASPDQSAFEEQEARDRAQEEELRDLKRKAIASGVVGAIAMVASMPLMGAMSEAPPILRFPQDSLRTTAATRSSAGR